MTPDIHKSQQHYNIIPIIGTTHAPTFTNIDTHHQLSILIVQSILIINDAPNICTCDQDEQ